MDSVKRQRLEAAGWTVGDASDFLGLSPEEAAFIEFKLALSKRLKQQRESQQLSSVTRISNFTTRRSLTALSPNRSISGSCLVSGSISRG